MKNRLPIHLLCIFMVYAFLVAPLIYTNSWTVLNVVELFISVFCFYAIGGSLLVPTGIGSQLSPLSHAGVSVFIGSLVFSMMIFITINPLFLFLLLLFMALLLVVWQRNNLEWSTAEVKINLFLFFIVLLLFALISTFDFEQQFSANISDRGFPYIDPYFFTSIVTSFRHGTIFSSSYEVGSPVNYQSLGFFIPALWADLLKISSHQALWGLAQPFYKFLAILFCYEVSYLFLKDKVAKNNYMFILLSVSLPLLLAPLRPMFIAKGIINKFAFIGVPYLLPTGFIAYDQETSIVWPIVNATWAISMFLALFSLFIFFKTDWKNKKITADKLFFTICASLIIVGKIPLYLSFMAMIGVIILKRILVDKEKIMNYLVYGIFSLLISGVLMNVCMSRSTAGRTYLKFDHINNSFLTEPIIAGYKNTNGFFHIVIYLCIVFGTYLAWTSIKLIGLTSLLKSKNDRFRELLSGCIFSIAVTTFLVFFMHIEIYDSHGNTIGDTSNDTVQFLAGSFYFVTIASVIGLIYIFYSNLNKILKNTVIIFTGMWCSISLFFLAYVFIYCAHERNVDCAQYGWYSENLTALKTGKYDDGLIVVNPRVSYYGIMLAASDYGKYWTAMDRSKLNFNGSIKGEYRWTMFKGLLEHPEEQYLSKMKADGVKYIIATPVDSAQLVNIAAQFPQHIHKDTQWIYEIN